MNKTAEWKQFGNTNYYISEYGDVLNVNTLELLGGGIDSSGYKFVNLRIDGVTITYSIHVLVAIVFHGFIPDGKKHVVHHKNGIKLDCHKDNLEVITFRANCSIERTAKSSSKYVGVTWCKRENKWLSRIRINGKLKHLGYFTIELDAHKAYQQALLSI